MKTFLIAAISVAAFGACRDNRYYCEGAPLNNCGLVDAKPDGGKTCSGDTQCPSPQVCDVSGTKTCVECTEEKDSACTGGKPVCGEDHACRACAAHRECDSGVCLGDGTCAAETTVAYVDGGMGSDAADCNRNTPCKTLGKALGTMRVVVKVSGTTVESGKVNIARAVKVVGDGGQVTGQSEPLLDVQSGGQLELVGLEVKPDGAFAPAACVAIGTGSTGKLVLVNTKVTRCGVLSTSSSGTVTGSTISGNTAGPGLSATGGTVTGSTISGNTAGPGLSATGGTVTVTGSTISGNTAGPGLSATGGTVTGSTFRSNHGGGIEIKNAVFKITNNVIADNGSVGNEGSDIGGVKVSSSMGGNVFDQNTVVHNRTRQIASDAAGVQCTVANFTASRNLVTNNVRETSYEVQTQGACVFAQSFTEPGNGTNALKFVNPAQANYHLTAESPATVRDVAGVTSCSGVDIDGDARPQGTACDLGADEYKP